MRTYSDSVSDVEVTVTIDSQRLSEVFNELSWLGPMIVGEQDSVDRAEEINVTVESLVTLHKPD